MPRRSHPLSRPPRRLVLPLLALLTFTLLLALVELSPLPSLDLSLDTSLASLASSSPLLVSLAKAVSTLGTFPVYLVLLVLLILYLLRTARPREALFALLAVLGSEVLNVLAKDLVHRPRPHLLHPLASATSWSFPSGHAQAVLTFSLTLLTLAPRRRLAPALLLWCLAMGFSRLLLGLHFLSDVLAGFALASFWVLLLALLFPPSPHPPLPDSAPASTP